MCTMTFIEDGQVVGTLPQLTIHSVNRTESGSYQCKATNTPLLGEESKPLTSSSEVNVDVLCKFMNSEDRKFLKLRYHIWAHYKSIM